MPLLRQRLQCSSRHIHIYAPATHLQTRPHLHTCDASPDLHTLMPPPRPYTYGTSPELRSSIPLLRQRLQRSSRHIHIYAPTTHLQTRPHLHACDASPDLHTSMPPPRPYTCGTPPELRSSIPLLRQRLQRVSRHIHIYTPATHLQTFIPRCLLHVPTLAARLKSFGAPYLF